MSTTARRGRPPKHPDNQRSCLLQVRVSPLEKAQLAAEASELGLSGISELVRRRALGKGSGLPTIEAVKSEPVSEPAAPNDFDRRVAEIERTLGYLPKRTARMAALSRARAEGVAGTSA